MTCNFFDFSNRFSRLKTLTLLTSHPDPEYDRIEWVPMLPVDSIRSDIAKFGAVIVGLIAAHKSSLQIVRLTVAPKSSLQIVRLTAAHMSSLQIVRLTTVLHRLSDQQVKNLIARVIRGRVVKRCCMVPTGVVRFLGSRKTSGSSS